MGSVVKEYEVMRTADCGLRAEVTGMVVLEFVRSS